MRFWRISYQARAVADVHDVDPASALELDLAEHSVITYYDASDLWLAQQLGAALVTLDGRL